MKRCYNEKQVVDDHKKYIDKMKEERVKAHDEAVRQKKLEQQQEENQDGGQAREKKKIYLIRN